jgi:hypothetical protein
MAQCQRIKGNGERCKSTVTGSNGLCYAHSPAYAHKRRKAASIAGRGNGEIAEIKEKLHKIAGDLLDPEISVSRGDAAVAIQAYNAILTAVRTELKQREQLELIERMEALEIALEARKRGAGYGA